MNPATTITEIYKTDIKARGAQTAADALDQIPGVNVKLGGKAQSFVYVRGFAQEDVKVLIDSVVGLYGFYRSGEKTRQISSENSRILLFCFTSSLLTCRDCLSMPSITRVTCCTSLGV